MVEARHPTPFPVVVVCILITLSGSVSTGDGEVGFQEEYVDALDDSLAQGKIDGRLHENMSGLTDGDTVRVMVYLRREPGLQQELEQLHTAGLSPEEMKAGELDTLKHYADTSKDRVLLE